MEDNLANEQEDPVGYCQKSGKLKISTGGMEDELFEPEVWKELLII